MVLVREEDLQSRLQKSTTMVGVVELYTEIARVIVFASPTRFMFPHITKTYNVYLCALFLRHVLHVSIPSDGTYSTCTTVNIMSRSSSSSVLQ